ncbi:MAG TPA: glycosyltransferase [Bryobacteraceae bacterium]|nr:glycosyltransferase [Bryobacteraceae bacterium]
MDRIRLNQIAIVLPVYNDWAAAQQLIPLIEDALARTDYRARVLLVDDASAIASPEEWPEDLHHIEEVSILHLRRNLGHQRAIAIGLVHLYQNWTDLDAVIVMDADGEDRPQDIPALLERFAVEGGRKVIFAARSKRLESAGFQFFYHAYRLLHKALTGVSVRVGNFSVLPKEALERLMVISELWNHYAAAIFRARIPFTSIPLPRGRRLAGRSKMNFASLVVHGLSAISVFSDVVGARLLALTAFAGLAVSLLIGLTAGIRLFTDLAIPGWATYVSGILLIILAQALIVSVALAFLIMNGRASQSFIPMRDAPLFAGRVEIVVPAFARETVYE